MKLNKVLVLGSGAIKIGEAGEFDYSGSQALKALKEENIKTILVNPNIATVQTDRTLADKVFLLPVNPEFVEKVIEKEKPDAILLGFGGQTALNCGVELEKKGILKKYGVKVLGTPISAINQTEDRELFRVAMENINVDVCKSKACSTVDDALNIAKNIGFPVMIRVGFTLGGKGSGVATNETELKKIVKQGLIQSRINQVLIEEYVGGWKEIEYEVMRDKFDNCITICNMENLDPMGIHTGESIVVAPSQTLTNYEYHNLRSISIKIIKSLGIIGECNVQFALDPKSSNYRVIEVNARLSRSSALASKATGYPIAYIGAKIVLGNSLSEIKNKVTGITSACFEPSLDYIVVKLPRWDLQKFNRVKRELGPQMKSVGEVMGIGRTFEEALQKSVRMLNLGDSLLEKYKYIDDLEEIKNQIHNPTDERLLHLVNAFDKGLNIQELNLLTNIDIWFLEKIKNIVSLSKKLKSEILNFNLLKQAKLLGFSDLQIASLTSKTEIEIIELREKLQIIPYIKQIDTLAGEWPAKTNYLYLTYNGNEDDVEFINEKKVFVLGSGPYRIGSSVEFDWCTVNAITSLKKHNIKSIVINCNPETVSTDYDISDRLYFENLSLEVIYNIYKKEQPMGIIVSVGGQIPNNLAYKLDSYGLKVLGTSPKNIDRAENRSKFSKLLDKLKINQPEWSTFSNLKSVKKFVSKIHYPVLVRPSYVLSGDDMKVVYNSNELEKFLNFTKNTKNKYNIVISKFFQDAKEIEVDGVSDGQTVVIGSIIEHIENAGVHSGDATMVIPPQTLTPKNKKDLINIATKIVRELKIIGPFNIQSLFKNNTFSIIECNIRASRSMPFVSKIRKMNLIHIAIEAMLKNKIEEVPYDEPKYVGVKVPQFSFVRLQGADPKLGVEMVSTGEVACFGTTFSDALLKAMISAELDIPQVDSKILITIADEFKPQIKNLAKKLNKLNFKIYATFGTAKYLEEQGVKTQILYKVFEDNNPNILNYLENKLIDLVITIPPINANNLDKEDNYIIRRKAIESNIPVIMNIELANSVVNAIESNIGKNFEISSINEYQSL